MDWYAETKTPTSYLSQGIIDYFSGTADWLITPGLHFIARAVLQEAQSGTGEFGFYLTLCDMTGGITIEFF